MGERIKRTDVKGLHEYLAQTGVGLSKSFIYRLVQENRIPHIKVGTKIIFDIDQIEEWLQSKEVS